ncbi:MAG: four helix bundle protein [Vicinamibacteraceae bacterium]|nr:four helix bundle protein [Vicinamibacteraceae bacterium]
MSRDHTRLTVFNTAHELALRVYRLTEGMPPAETYSLRAQVRRAALSVSTNIVEGCARTTRKEYLRFLTIACSSASEVRYLLKFALDLEMLPPGPIEACQEEYLTLIRQLQNLRTAVAGLPQTPGKDG